MTSITDMDIYNGAKIADGNCGNKRHIADFEAATLPEHLLLPELNDVDEGRYSTTGPVQSTYT